MATPTSITGANAILMLAVFPLFPVPQQIQGFAADDVFEATPIDSAEVLMGVDGKLSGGFVYQPIPQGISIQADSKSNDLFDTWWTSMQAALAVFQANGIMSFPSIGRKWVLQNGFLTSYPWAPSLARTLRPRKYGITWERVFPAPG